MRDIGVEQMYVVRGDEDLAAALFDALEDAEELRLKSKRFWEFGVHNGFGDGYRARVWKQKNIDATRKVTRIAFMRDLNRQTLWARGLSGFGHQHSGHRTPSCRNGSHGIPLGMSTVMGSSSCRTYVFMRIQCLPPSSTTDIDLDSRRFTPGTASR